MIKRSSLRTIGLTCSCLLLTGCMPKFTIEDIKNMTPERPVEIDKLEMFVGTWETEAEMNMSGLDEVLTGTGVGTMSWKADKRYLVEESEFDMGELGKMSGMGMWTYDPKSRKYRNYWFDSHGSVGRGTSKYCEESRTWYTKATSRGPWGKTKGKGTTKFVDDNTIEWSWTEWDGSGLFKVMDVSGTSRRK
ncbi:MAG: DUF1579 family protein [Phycisphaerales bacterium]|nr:MAG: DUF1579 family protein [Phycisphaerales bacterium]